MKSVVQVAYVLTVYVDVTLKFVYRKTQKMTLKEDKILIKILQQEKRYDMKRLLATHNCEASATED